VERGHNFYGLREFPTQEQSPAGNVHPIHRKEQGISFQYRPCKEEDGAAKGCFGCLNLEPSQSKSAGVIRSASETTVSQIPPGSTALIRICQSSPLALNVSIRSASRRKVICILMPLPTGRPPTCSSTQSSHCGGSPARVNS